MTGYEFLYWYVGTFAVVLPALVFTLFEKKSNFNDGVAITFLSLVLSLVISSLLAGLSLVLKTSPGVGIAFIAMAAIIFFTFAGMKYKQLHERKTDDD